MGTALLIVGICSVAISAGVYFSADAIASFYDKPIASALQIMALSAPFMAVCWVFASAIRALRIVLYEVYGVGSWSFILLLGGLGGDGSIWDYLAWLGFNSRWPCA